MKQLIGCILLLLASVAHAESRFDVSTYTFSAMPVGRTPRDRALALVRAHERQLGIDGELRPWGRVSPDPVQRLAEWIGDVRVEGSYATVWTDTAQVIVQRPKKIDPELLAKARAFRFTPVLKDSAKDVILAMLRERSGGRFGAPESFWTQYFAARGLTMRDAIEVEPVIYPAGHADGVYLYVTLGNQNAYWVRADNLQIVPYSAAGQEGNNDRD